MTNPRLQPPTNPPQATHHPRHAFTLLELIAVLALIATVSAIAIASLARTSPVADEHRAVRQLADHLITARAAALRTNTPIPVTITVSDHASTNPDNDTRTLTIDLPGRIHTLDTPLLPIDRLGRPITTIHTPFAPDGRTPARLIRLATDPATARRAADLRLLDEPFATRQLPNADADPTSPPVESGDNPDRLASLADNADRLAPGRLWLINFNPISGQPTITALGPGAPRSAQPTETQP